MVTRAGGSFAAVPAMVDASVKRGASEEKTRISNLMDAVMTASGGRTRISVLMDAVMKASEADDADVFSWKLCSWDKGAAMYSASSSFITRSNRVVQQLKWVGQLDGLITIPLLISHLTMQHGCLHRVSLLMIS
jgi:hypothetical protein